MNFVIYGMCLYGIWLWPLMVVFGFAFGLKRLLTAPEQGSYWIPLFIAALGIMMLALPSLILE